MKTTDVSTQGVLGKITVILLTFVIVAAVNADDIVPLPPVRAVPGENVICYGYDCAAIVESMLGPPPPLFSTQVIEITDSQQIDNSEFCRQLNDKKPDDCNGADPPSTPGADPNWQPNGCGTSGFVSTLMDIGIMALVPDEFAGDYNAPYSGVSFLGACNAHDQCYGFAFDKAFCDERFGDDMRAACGVVSDSAGHSVCQGLAGIYEGAVASTTFGANAHASAVSDHTCAIWAKDMDANGCDE